MANRPDIIIKIEKRKHAVMDVAVPADRNVIQKGVEKKLKYKGLCL